MNTLPTNIPTIRIDADLTPEQAKRLAQLEPIIERGLHAFLEVGNALLEIRNCCLYRQAHSTFKNYVEDRWHISERRAYQLCEAAEVVNSLPVNLNHGSVLNERQARELARIAPERRLKVLQQAAADGQVTAKSIRKAAQMAHTEVAGFGDRETAAPDQEVVRPTAAAKGRLNPRHYTRKRFQHWWLTASKAERGEFLHLLFFKEIVVKDKAKLWEHIEQWFRLCVKEANAK
jgi:hypothetical protein